MNHFLYKVFFSLIFLSTFCFAQNEPPVKQEVDSAAYYEQLYQYNLDKYNFDKKAANIALITAGVSIGLAMVSGFSITFYVFEQYSEGNKSPLSMSHPWAVTTFILCGIGATSAFVYGGFEIAAAVRKDNYSNYNIRRKKYSVRQATKVGFAPIVDPINKTYGGALALNF
ncbi:hypothetical protein SAMN05720473_101248 [Fibrobacter sp. UWB15]|uniref:hypothetical protein n=1 Tax=unclassified Fibrobacter TaxID=2634177 RepID=UPI00091B15D3|nr:MULTISPECIES: hypothetical protein [unclassified Fibrobacter]PWJ67378.1 hypothetical protein BGW99_101248 [Fibrobacter sp. UWB6]SHF65930.1 hypothetical protein SAMN05720760_101213 [Fibrobacter sp. UWB8]SMG09972.1 hypothetical protein SAMN05720473_101248 [Fibrobacter sp. UWB15]